MCLKGGRTPRDDTKQTSSFSFLPAVFSHCEPWSNREHWLFFQSGYCCTELDSFLPSFSRLSFPMDVMMKWSPAVIVVGGLRRGERPCCMWDWTYIRNSVRRA